MEAKREHIVYKEEFRRQDQHVRAIPPVESGRWDTVYMTLCGLLNGKF